MRWNPSRSLFEDSLEFLVAVRRPFHPDLQNDRAMPRFDRFGLDRRDAACEYLANPLPVVGLRQVFPMAWSGCPDPRRAD